MDKFRAEMELVRIEIVRIATDMLFLAAYIEKTQPKRKDEKERILVAVLQENNSDETE